MARRNRTQSLAAAVAATLAITTAQPSTGQMRGVNIGGWLVLESWIRPSLYANYSVPDGAGEWQFCAKLGQTQCSAALQQHHAEWFTQDQVNTLASAGFTHFRIPVGYWILGGDFIAPGEPYVAVGWPALVNAIGWANQAGVKVIVDLHGAPGSQNGHDNSGCTGPIGWLNGTNRERTTAVLVELAARLMTLNATAGYEGTVVGIETLNEPWTTQVNGPIPFPDLAAWYKNATDALRAAGWTGQIWHHDGFSPDNAVWEGFLPPTQGYTDVYLDTHQYFCFGGYDGQTPWQLVRTVCNSTGPSLQRLTDRDWLVVGEWSMSMDNDVSPPTPLTSEGHFAYKAFAEAQLDAYGMLGPTLSTPKGGFFWCHKTENSLAWSVLDGLAQGYFPNFTVAGDSVQGAGRLTCKAMYG